MNGAETVTTTIPVLGKLWIEARLLSQLSLGDSSALGEMRFIIE
ncbi:MAG: hypothetical protein ABFS56_21385 [Pseudomonadota bacterium]